MVETVAKAEGKECPHGRGPPADRWAPIAGQATVGAPPRTPEPARAALSRLYDMEVKAINKRASGQAFEVILKPQSTDLSPDQPVSPKKKEISLEELQQQLDAAEDRRKSQEMQLLQQLAEKQQHRRIVLHRAIVDNCDFSRTTERKLNQKMEVCNENRKAHIAALKDRLREKERHAAEVRRNKVLREELSG